jgi:hypothetical protein
MLLRQSGKNGCAGHRIEIMFDQAKADRICERLSRGESLRKASDAEGVAPSSVLYWQRDHPEFAEQYARARDIGYRLLADEIVEIADDGSNDTIKTDKGEITDHDVIARSRLRVDTRKWMLSKMLPKIYGDKIIHSGDPENPITNVTRVELVSGNGKS